MSSKSLLSLIILICLIGANTSFAVDRHVAPTGADGENDCLSVANPCATVGHAIAQASSGDIILVAAGEYIETIVVDRDVTIQGEGVTATFIQGGATPRWWESGGGGSGSAIISINLDAEVQLDNLTIRYGCGYSIVNAGDLTATALTVAEGGGLGCYGAGAIWNTGRLVLENSTVSHNMTYFNRIYDPSYAAVGIHNRGELILKSSIISHNASIHGFEAGGISNEPSGTVEIINSEISDNHSDHHVGGIDNQGTMTISRTSIRNNHADEGQVGGVLNAGVLLVRQSVIDGNTGWWTIGGIWNSSQLWLENVTISNNISYLDHGGVVNSGVLEARHTTIVANHAGEFFEDIDQSERVSTGGLANSGTARLYNTIVAGNSSEFGPPDCIGSELESFGYNIIGDADGCSIVVEANPGTDHLGVDPLLEPLADNGGQTFTHALTQSSSAVDAVPFGVNGCGTDISEDQRGLPRPWDSDCDIGAFELQAEDLPSAPVIEASSDSLDFGSIAVGDTSIISIDVRNVGNAVLQISQITTNLAAFSAVVTEESVEAGDSTIVNVAFSPTEASAYADTLRIYSNADTLSIPLTGNGVDAAVAIDPASLDFAGTMVLHSDTLSVRISNPGGAELEIDSVSVSLEAFATQFEPVVAAGDSSHIDVVFRPSITGSYSDTLRVYTNAQEEAVEIPLSASAVSPLVTSLDPPRLDFGVVLTGSSDTLTLQIRNVGSVVASVTGASTSLPIFTLLGEPGDVQAGNELEIGIVFSPSETGVFTDTLRVPTNVTSDPISIALRGEVATEVDTENGEGLPTSFALHQNYPNPFNPTTSISFALPEASDVSLIVYDVSGRTVITLVDDPLATGRHEVDFDATSLPSGMYLYRLVTPAKTLSRSMHLVK